MFCRTCEYDLSHHDGRRCPECGRSFDPDDARTFHRTARPTLVDEFGDLLTGFALPVAAMIAIVLILSWVFILIQELS